MTIKASKLIMGMAFATVVFLLFSSVPTAAEQNDDVNAVEEGIDVVSDESSQGTDSWEWDEVNSVLTIKKDLTVPFVLVTIDNAVDSEPAKIIINAKLTVTKEISAENNCIWIQSYGRSCLITGSGELNSDVGIRMDHLDNAESNSFLAIDGIKMQLETSEGTAIDTGTHDLKITNCPKIEINCVEEDTGGLFSATTITIQNTNLYINHSGLEEPAFIIGYAGIIMDGTPTGDLSFEPGPTFVSGETTSINSASSEPGIKTMAFESYTEPAEDVTPIAVGIFIVLLALVAVGTFVVYGK